MSSGINEELVKRPEDDWVKISQAEALLLLEETRTEERDNQAEKSKSNISDVSTDNHVEAIDDIWKDDEDEDYDENEEQKKLGGVKKPQEIKDETNDVTEQEQKELQELKKKKELKTIGMMIGLVFFLLIAAYFLIFSGDSNTNNNMDFPKIAEIKQPAQPSPVQREQLKQEYAISEQAARVPEQSQIKQEYAMPAETVRQLEQVPEQSQIKQEFISQETAQVASIPSVQQQAPEQAINAQALEQIKQREKQQEKQQGFSVEQVGNNQVVDKNLEAQSKNKQLVKCSAISEGASLNKFYVIDGEGYIGSTLFKEKEFNMIADSKTKAVIGEKAELYVEVAEKKFYLNLEQLKKSYKCAK